MSISEILSLILSFLSVFSAVVIYITRKEIKSENSNFKDWVRLEFEKQESTRRESARRQYEEYAKLEDRVRILESAFKLDSQMFSQTLGFLKEQFEEYKRSISDLKTQIEKIGTSLVELKAELKSRRENES